MIYIEKIFFCGLIILQTRKFYVCHQHCIAIKWFTFRDCKEEVLRMPSALHCNKLVYVQGQDSQFLPFFITKQPFIGGDLNLLGEGWSGSCLK
jgi:hypothetical protein